MKRANIGVIAAAILAVATVAWAQKPDFSGTWTADPAATGTTGTGERGGRGMAGPITVKQTADTLIIERQGGQDNTITTTYKLDGTESVNTMQGRGGGTTEARSVAKWDGPKLVITTKRQMGDQTVETSETWTLANNVLTIERTGGRGGPSTTIYKKST